MSKWRRVQVGPGMPPEDTTGLPVDLPPERTVAPSGVSGDLYGQDGTGFSPDPSGSVADWHGEGEVPGAPPASGLPGSVIGGHHDVEPTPYAQEPIDQRVMLQQQHDLLRAFTQMSHKLTAALDQSRPQLVREVPAMRGQSIQYTIPATAATAVRFLGEDPERRRAVIVLETDAAQVRMSADQQAANAGQGFRLWPNVPVEVRAAGEIWMVATAGAAPVVVSAWVERGEPWQVPEFGSFTEHDTRSGEAVASMHSPRGHHRNGGGGV